MSAPGGFETAVPVSNLASSSPANAEDKVSSLCSYGRDINLPPEVDMYDKKLNSFKASAMNFE